MARLEDHEGREALERQVCEVEALLAIFDGDDGVAIEVSGLAAVQAALDDDDADVEERWKTAIASAGEEDDACLRVVLTFADADALELSSVRMRLPLGYPERCGPEIDLGSKFLNERCESALECLVSEERGQECLFQVVQLLRESVDEGLRDLREEEEGDGDGDEGSSLIGGSVGLAGSVEALGLSDRTEATVLGRRLCFSHHIIAPSKRSAVVNWALELKLGGCSKIGWPGLIAVEGDERHCQLYVSMLQRLRWKKFVVRGEEQFEVEGGTDLDGMRRLPRGFCEFQQDEMHLFAQTLKDAGLEDLFLTSMGMYNKGKGGGGAAKGSGGKS